MRKIKFRAWNKALNKMYSHEDLLSLTKNITINNFATGVYLPLNSDIELMQYTGLKDKNGKEVYEGDIVKFLDEKVTYSYCGADYNVFINTGKVIFSHDELMGWDITNRNMVIEEVWHYREYIEVIGNIYEDSELLNQDRSFK